ncbi:50S ribosomal protein L3 [Candidatus Mycoplasma haematohominis]|uniref:50S ribosomal protein L3 n=1 Tax=Candidatus Mycoplasma haematohominis TaxID=1494318 RepID=A0A478FS00_9MOLU|nr:50S ribosomal protein L3 [Candidatus Mycoplasma haemohominis]
MTQLFSETGELVPVTVIEVAPNLVVDIKTQERNKYSAVVVGYGEIREKLVNKPLTGQYKKAGKGVRRHVYELKGLDSSKYQIGDSISFENLFKIGDLIDVQGTTKGHGFTGAIKLWNFRCGPKSHGAGYPHRFGGSLETGRGGSAAQKVWKGKKMGGRYGSELVTAVNLEIVHTDQEKKLIFLRGCVPGKPEGIVKLKPTTRKRKQVSAPFKIYKNKSIDESASVQQ